MKESILLLDTLMQVALMEQNQEKKLQLLKQISSKCHKLTMDLFNSIDQLNQIRTNALNKVDDIEVIQEETPKLDYRNALVDLLSIGR